MRERNVTTHRARMPRLPRAIRRLRRTVTLAVALSPLLFVVAMVSSYSGSGQPVLANTVILRADTTISPGFDECTDPSESTLLTEWDNTDMFGVGLYIGGDELNVNCPLPSYLNASYIKAITSGTDGDWLLNLWWVGPQAPNGPGCDNYANNISENTSTAFTEGEDQAIDAYNEMYYTLGMDTDTPLIYDLEAFDGAECNAEAATKAFVSGWDTQLAYSPAQDSGVYGSTGGSNLVYFASSSPPPVFIDGAYWDGNPAVTDMYEVPSGDWDGYQRLKQFNDLQKCSGGIGCDYDSYWGPMYQYPPTD